MSRVNERRIAAETSSTSTMTINVSNDKKTVVFRIRLLVLRSSAGFTAIMTESCGFSE